jgi:hypothetical protein
MIPMAHFSPTMGWRRQENSERSGTSTWKTMAGERVKLQYFINVVAAFAVLIRKSGADSGECTNMHSLIARDFPAYDVLAISCTFLILDMIDRDRRPRSNVAAAMDFKKMHSSELCEHALYNHLIWI